MPFRIDETSGIIVRKGNLPETRHQELSDAMQEAVNWLATQPIETKVIIIETTTVTKKSE